MSGLEFIGMWALALGFTAVIAGEIFGVIALLGDNIFGGAVGFTVAMLTVILPMWFLVRR